MITFKNPTEERSQLIKKKSLKYKLVLFRLWQK